MTDTAGGRDDGNGAAGSYHWSGDGCSPSLAIIDALADIEGVAPTSLDSLYDTVDPDALDSILDGDKGSRVVVEFRRGDYVVTVRGDGEIRIREAEGDGE